MVGHGGSSAGSYLADPTSPIPSHCVSIVVTSTVRVKYCQLYSFIGYLSCLGLAIQIEQATIEILATNKEM